jgi:hypothetical protein
MAAMIKRTHRETGFGFRCHGYDNLILCKKQMIVGHTAANILWHNHRPIHQIFGDKTRSVSGRLWPKASCLINMGRRCGCRARSRLSKRRWPNLRNWLQPVFAGLDHVANFKILNPDQTIIAMDQGTVAKADHVDQHNRISEILFLAIFGFGIP